MIVFQQFPQNLNSMDWWISVVVVSLLLNILGEFIVRLFDKILSKFNSSYRNKSEKRRLGEIEKSKVLWQLSKRSPNYFIWYQMEAQNDYVGYIFSYIMGFLMIIMSLLFLKILNSVFVAIWFAVLYVSYLGMAYYRRSNYMKKSARIDWVLEMELEKKQ
jgi:hypothetical protein